MLNIKPDVRHVHFASVSELAATVERKPTRSVNRERHSAITSGREGERSARWYGCTGGVNEVRKIVAAGWPQGADEVEALYSRAVKRLPNAIDVRRRRLRGDMGDSLDIHAVYRGDMSRAWERTTRQLRHGTSLVRIVADICNNAYTSAEELKVRGFAALALSRILNKAGYSTEIVAAIGLRNSSRNSNRQLITITVKPRHVVQDTRMLAATVGLAGFFRVFGFLGIIHLADSNSDDVSGALGQAEPVENYVLADARVMQTVTPALYNMKQAEEWIAKTVQIFQSSTMAAESRGR